MPGPPRRIFLSHTSELRENPRERSFVAAAEDAVKRVGDQVVDMAYFTARDDKPASYCRQRVQGSDIYVGIIGFRYGSVVKDQPDTSYVALEHEAAERAGIPRLMFLLDDEPDVPLPRSCLVDPEFGARQDAFRASLKDTTFATFRTPDQLETLLQQALFQMRETAESGGSGLARRVAGHRPTGSLDAWHDRDEVRRQLTQYLAEGRRITSVYGRRGVGKSGVVTRVLADYDVGDGAGLGIVDGVVYLSTRSGSGEMTLARIFGEMASLLPQDQEDRLTARWASTGADALDDLFEAMRSRRIVVVLDNIDDLQDPETGDLRNPGVLSFLDAVWRTPYPPRVVTTSQKPLTLPAEMATDVTLVPLQDGLEPKVAASLLRQLDRDGAARLRDADEVTLESLARRVAGLPRGLQLVVAYLRSHRVRGVERLLEADHPPDELLRDLVCVVYEELSEPERRVIEVIAVAAVPFPAADLTTVVDGIDDAVDELLRRQVLVLGDDDLIRLHPLDTDHVWSRLSKERQVLLDLKLADYYAARRGDPSAWRHLTDVTAVKREHQHRVRAGRMEEALDALATAAEFIARHGDAGTLVAAVAKADERGLGGCRGACVCRGMAAFFSGSLSDAIRYFREASMLEGGSPEWDLWAGTGLRHEGRSAESVVMLRAVAQNPAAARATRMLAAFELGLALCYAGKPEAADEAVGLLDSLADASDPADTSARRDDLLALQHLVARRYEASAAAAERAMERYADSPWSDVVGYVANVRALSRLYRDDLTSAAEDFLAIGQAAAALAQDRLEGPTTCNLAWSYLRLGDTVAAGAAAARAADRLRACGADGADSADALAAVAHGEPGGAIAELLDVAVAAGRRNPDFYAPSPAVVAQIQSRLLQGDAGT